MRYIFIVQQIIEIYDPYKLKAVRKRNNASAGTMLTPDI